MTPLSLYDLESIAFSLRKPSRTKWGWVAQCPAHDDQTPSLSLALGNHGELLAYCHAGCSFEAVLRALKRRGLVSVEKKAFHPVRHHEAPRKEKKKDDDLQRSEYARSLWQRSSSAQKTLVEAYLLSRMGHYLTFIPATIRYLSALKHTPTGQFYLNMLSAVARYPGKKVLAVHRTFLRSEGTQDDRSK